MMEWAIDRESKRSRTLSLLSPSMFLKFGKAARWVRAAGLLSILGVDMRGSANVFLSFFSFAVLTHTILPSMFLKFGKAARWVRAAGHLSILGVDMRGSVNVFLSFFCLLYTSPSPRDATLSRMPSSA